MQVEDEQLTASFSPEWGFFRPRRSHRVRELVPGAVTWAILWGAANAMGILFLPRIAWSLGIVVGAIRQPYLPDLTPVMMLAGMFGFLVGCFCGALVKLGMWVFGLRPDPGGWVGYGGLSGLLGWWTGVTLMALDLFGHWNSFSAWSWVAVTAISAGIMIMLIMSFWGRAFFGAVGAFGHPVVASVLLLVLVRFVLSDISQGQGEEQPQWEPATAIEIEIEEEGTAELMETTGDQRE